MIGRLEKGPGDLFAQSRAEPWAESGPKKSADAPGERLRSEREESRASSRAESRIGRRPAIGPRQVRAGAFGLALACFGAPALAQTTQDRFDEAYRLCVADYGDPSDIGPALVEAGFSHQPEQVSETEILHWYSAPGDADVTILLRTTPLERFCAISSDQIGLSEALQTARALTQTLFPDGLTMPGDMQGRNVQIDSQEGQNEACSGFWTVLGEDVLWVSAGIAGQDPVCIENGTSQLMVVM
ncbi:hypothetical protein FIU86_01475 [Roseovarius sp. THAF9]|uniref:hypothetical protein n=1 Tax=Roseovarius sp. THAF9 TaxID=2587847 RepID=UPI0012A87F02|nr:hypothetical protein [Roseovarius sp. THAF9]QFT91498.1 hypothetical protein FIU86_01475 [Roseovarius sp. THAF9]